MKLLFAGDLAWPNADVMSLGELEQLCADAITVVNLEGGVITDAAERCTVNNEHKFNLFSHPSVIDTLARLNVVACSLANNHISDYVGAITTSKSLLAERGIRFFGSRQQPWTEFTMNGQQFVVYAACSPLPEPRQEKTEDQAHLFKPASAMAELQALRLKFPDAKIVAFMHWGYELATYPQPADREWARQAIDNGVDLVIGHHPHVVQGLEFYGKGMIAYSLGNFVLPQVDFRGHRLHYKSAAVCEQLVIAVQDDAGITAHWLHYDTLNQKVRYIAGGDALSDARLKERTPFAGMNDDEYRSWFASTGRFGSEGKLAKTVFWSYQGWGRIDSAVKLAFLGAKSIVRKLAMRIGLHKPYNW